MDFGLERSEVWPQLRFWRLREGLLLYRCRGKSFLSQVANTSASSSKSRGRSGLVNGSCHLTKETFIEVLYQVMWSDIGIVGARNTRYRDTPTSCS